MVQLIKNKPFIKNEVSYCLSNQKIRSKSADNIFDLSEYFFVFFRFLYVLIYIFLIFI